MHDEVLGSVLSKEDHAVVMDAARRLERALKQPESDVISCPEHTRKLLELRLAHLEHEVFGVMWLDGRNRLICWEELFRGTVDAANVWPREIVKSALHYNGAAAILAHCHPSGEVEPSMADRNITERIKGALELIQVRTLDHVIIGNGQYFSFAEHGYL